VCNVAEDLSLSDITSKIKEICRDNEDSKTNPV